MDVLFANGSWLPFFNADTANQGACLGREFSGRNSKGQKVFGLVSGSALATHVLADRSTLWEVPDKWTLEQASTISVAYVLVSQIYFPINYYGILKTHKICFQFMFNFFHLYINKYVSHAYYFKYSYFLRHIMQFLYVEKFNQMNQCSLIREQIIPF